MTMEGSLIRPTNPGIMDDDSGFSSDSDESMESGSSTSASSSETEAEAGPLFEMTSLISQLPFKRGLSKHFEGKSQSFTCLSNVRSVEDLAKPMKAKKKMKQCKSYVCVLDGHKTIAKKGSRGGSFSSLGPRGRRAQGPPERSVSRTLLFA